MSYRCNTISVIATRCIVHNGWTNSQLVLLETPGTLALLMSLKKKTFF